MRDHLRMKQALNMLPEAYSGTSQGYQSLKYCNYRDESLGQIDTTSEKIRYWRIFWKSFMSASLICCCVGCDWHGSNRDWQSNWFFWTQSVGPVENISLASDYLYSENYRTKENKNTIWFHHSSLFSLVTRPSWGTFGVRDLSQGCACFFFL